MSLRTVIEAAWSAITSLTERDRHGDDVLIERLDASVAGTATGRGPALVSGVDP